MKGRCAKCGEVTLWIARPVFDGFTKTGEHIVCSDCGTEQKAPAPPPPAKGAAPVKRALPGLFDEDDRPETVRVFEGNENQAMCNRCAHYLVNAFTQRCGLTLREVKATDTCGDFKAKG